MNLSMAFVKGLALGLEYVDLDEDDQEQLGNDGNMMIILSLGFIRFVYLNGSDQEE